MNPYDPPSPAVDESPAGEDISAEVQVAASPIWFAATVTAVALLIGLYFDRTYYSAYEFIVAGGQENFGILVSDVMKPLAIGSMFMIAAVAMYYAAKSVVKDRFDFRSTRRSQIAAGVLTSFAYFAGCYATEVHRVAEGLTWITVSIVGIPMMCLIVVLEKRVAARQSYGRQSSLGPTHVANHSPSIMWFSAGCVVLAAIMGVVIDVISGDGYFRQSVSMMLIEIAAVSALFCVMGTVSYGIANQLVRRSNPPTIVSRLAAATVFVPMMFLMITLMRDVQMPSSLLFALIFIVTPLVAGPMSVAIDRWIANRKQPQPSVLTTNN